jgi:CRP-like cAMP-binding protein
MISAVVVLRNGTMIEAQAVGNDGFTPLLPAIEMERAETTALVQIPGPALRINADTFRRHLESPELRRRAFSYMADALRLIGQSAACIAFHPVQARLARWLLIVRDNTGRDEFPLTQDAMAAMLGVHRPTVTIAIRTLEASGVIEHRRGRVRLVDSEALTIEACECYRLRPAPYAATE